MLRRLPLDVSFPKPQSLVWLLSRVLMGEETQTVEFREQCLWPGANSTSRARVDDSISVLGYRQPGYLSWLSSYLQPAPWKSSSSGFPESFALRPGENAGLEGMRGRWQKRRAGEPISGCEEVHPIGTRGCCGYCVLGLQ